MLLFHQELFNTYSGNPKPGCLLESLETFVKGESCQIPSRVFRIQNSRNEAWTHAFLRVPAFDELPAAWFEPGAVMASGMILEALRVSLSLQGPEMFLLMF